MELNSASLITREAIKNPKEVMLNNQKDFKGWKDSVLHQF